MDIQFHLLHGSAGEVLPGFVAEHSLGAVVTDFSPLREPLQWLEEVKATLPSEIPLIQVQPLTFNTARVLNLLLFTSPFPPFFLSVFLHDVLYV